MDNHKKTELMKLANKGIAREDREEQQFGRKLILAIEDVSKQIPSDNSQTIHNLEQKISSLEAIKYDDRDPLIQRLKKVEAWQRKMDDEFPIVKVMNKFTQMAKVVYETRKTIGYIREDMEKLLAAATINQILIFEKLGATSNEYDVQIQLYEKATKKTYQISTDGLADVITPLNFEPSFTIDKKALKTLTEAEKTIMQDHNFQLVNDISMRISRMLHDLDVPFMSIIKKDGKITVDVRTLDFKG